MKKNIIFIVVCLLLTGCGNKDLNTNKDLNNLDEIPEEKIYTKVSIMSDYLIIYPEDLYTNAKLVVIGKYVEKGNSYVGPSGTAKTIHMFNVEKVLKGDCSKKKIGVGIDGGIVTLKEYINSLSTEQIKKQGLKNVDPTDKYVKFELTDETSNKSKATNASNIEIGKSYILFLDYDSYNKTDYIATANYYSVLELNDSKIYDEKTQNYILIDNLNK